MYSLMRNLLLMGLLGCIITVCKGDEIKVFNLCKTNHKVTTLGEEEAIITHEGYTSVEWCHWTIPDSVKKDHHAVILWLENITLPYMSGGTGCRGQLKVPGLSYDCEGKNSQSYTKNGACWVYTTDGAAACGTEFIKNETAKENLTCNAPQYWKILENPAQIGYNRQSGENHYKRFTIHYKPISCLETTTAPQDISTTTMMSVLVTKQPTFSMNGEMTTSLGTATKNEVFQSGKPSIDKTTAESTSNTNRQNGSFSTVAVAVTIPIIVIILLLVAFLVWHRNRKHTKTVESGHKREVVENEIYGTDIISDSPEAVTSQDFENTTFDEKTEDDDCLYTAVNKETKKKPLTLVQLHGNNDLSDNTDDNDESGDVYAVVQKHKVKPSVDL